MGAPAAVVTFVALTSVPIGGQAPAAAAATKTADGRKTPNTGTVRRTPDGRPDLQGVWNFATATPLERPAELAGKQFLTDEEAARLERQIVEGRNLDRRLAQGDVGAYNDFWVAWGTKVVGTRRTSLITDPPDGKMPPLTPEAQKKQAARAEITRRPATGPEDRSLSERCMLGFNAGPPIVTGPYNNYLQLFQTHDYVVILNEMIHNARIVPLNGRPHLGQTIRQWSGDSRGRWEGDTLVVETTNFRDDGTGNITIRVSNDGNLHLIERFTRAGADTLLYEFTVSDPTIWTRPWTAEIPMTKSDESMYEYACHEGNYAMRGILAGARAQEKAAEDGATKR